MKKGLLLFTIAIAIILSACSPLNESMDKDSSYDGPSSGDSEEDKSSDKEVAESEDSGDDVLLSHKYSIEDFYPYLEDRVLDYEGRGIEFAEETSYFEFIDGNKAQIKTVNPGTTIVKIVEKKDGTLKEIYSEGEFYHIENLLDREANKEEIILKEPLEVGNSWENAEGDIKEITGLGVEIKTPYKTFEALEVTTKKDNGQVREYYVEGLGLVASLYQEGDFKVESLLRSMDKKSRKLAIEKYYPIDVDSDIVYVEDEISFETNGNIIEKLEEVLKNPPSKELIPLISEETRINSINLDRNDWRLRVDFSSDLVLDMNYGSAMETMILESIINTLGRFYDVKGVSITLDGKAYESGHYYFKEDEVQPVRTEGLKKFEP